MLRSNFVTKQWMPSRTVMVAFTFQPGPGDSHHAQGTFVSFFLFVVVIFLLPIGTQWLTSTLSLPFILR